MSQSRHSIPVVAPSSCGSDPRPGPSPSHPMIARTVFFSAGASTVASAVALVSFSNPFSSHAYISKPIPPLTPQLQFLLISWYFSAFCIPFFRLSLWPSRGPVHYLSPFLIFGFVIVISTTPFPISLLYSYRLSHRFRWSRRCSYISSTYLRRFAGMPSLLASRTIVHAFSAASVYTYNRYVTDKWTSWNAVRKSG